MKYFSKTTKTFVIVGVHGADIVKNFINIDTKIGTDEDGKDITVSQKHFRGMKVINVPDDWLQIEDNDPLLGHHPGKLLQYNETKEKLELVNIPALSDEVILSKARAVAKADRTKQVAAIKVTVDNMEFDGDEKSQERMARAILASENDVETTKWILSDNTPVQVTALQLKQVLRLSGLAQTAIWEI